MFHTIEAKDLTDSLFLSLGQKWMLVTAGTGEDCNTMTAGWGGIGTIWGAPTATCYVRPQRYTREYLDREEYFTLTFFGEAYRKQLELCGRVSGRDVDKVKACGFTVRTASCGAPYFEEAELVLVCKKTFRQEMDPRGMAEGIEERWYPEKDHHILYMGEIVEVLKK